MQTCLLVYLTFIGFLGLFFLFESLYLLINDHPRLWDTAVYCCIIGATKNILRCHCCSRVGCALFEMPAISLGRMRALPTTLRVTFNLWWHKKVLHHVTRDIWCRWLQNPFGTALQLLYLCYIKLLVTKEIINIKTRAEDDRILCLKSSREFDVYWRCLPHKAGCV